MDKLIDRRRQRELRRRKKRLQRIKRRIISGAVLLGGIALITTVFNNNSINSENNNRRDISLRTSMQENYIDDFVITIDAGHGDWDVGAEGITGSYEKDIALDVSLMVGEILEKIEGISVVYTRTNDTLEWSDIAVENLYERVAISEAANSDVFISIHCNGAYDSNFYGVETWYNPECEDGFQFANIVQASLSDIGYTQDRGVKTYDAGEELAVLNNNSATSALIELGFISNWNDEAYLLTEEGKISCAEAIAESVIEYKELKGL